MIETAVAMVLALLVFLLLFELSDLVRAKLLAENASVKCARARAVGYNDFMLRKIARLSMMPASGKCLTQSPRGDGDDVLSPGERVSRIGDYLASGYEAQADAILDYEYWRDGQTSVSSADDSARTTATVAQFRPGTTGAKALAGLKDDAGGETKVSASAAAEMHYKSFLQ